MQYPKRMQPGNRAKRGCHMKAPKLFNFLSFRIYRRTFLTYIIVTLVLIAGVTTVLTMNAHKTGLDSFSATADSTFTNIEMKRENVTNSIDRLFYRIYSNPALEQDFYLFFGAKPEDYVQSLLERVGSGYETYTAAAHTIVSESGYCIRNILYDANGMIYNMEYNGWGYSRYALTDRENAERLRVGRIESAKSIVASSGAIGEISFLIDLSDYLNSQYGKKTDEAVALVINGAVVSAGGPSLTDEEWLDLAGRAQKLGTARLQGGTLFYSVKTSEAGYSVVSVAPRQPYLQSSLYTVVGIILCVIAAFAYITLLYGRQFSQDAGFLRELLDSMTQAQSSNFVPVHLTGRSDEYGQIAEHLNDLYTQLQLLIQQKYILTINQQRTEMQMLSSQLNPHFLYNTLERIRFRALREGASQAAEATASLGQLYRNIVKTESIITIERELDITAQYLDLMAFLYGDQLIYHIDADEDVKALQTPKIWMQPILENFFKHNFRDDEQIKVVVITARKLRDGCLMEFFDNLGSIPEEQLQKINEELTPDAIREYTQLPGKGIGLQNVYQRLCLYYGGHVQMQLLNNTPAGVRIRIFIQNEEENANVSSADRR